MRRPIIGGMTGGERDRMFAELKLVTRPCQCEHIAHFERARLTPNGNPGHKYGVKYAERVLTRINDSFEVCKDCLEDCYSERP